MTSPVSLSELVGLLQSVDSEATVLVDKTTGAIRLSEEQSAPSDREERFPVMSAQDELELAAAFTETVEDWEDRQRLQIALAGAQPNDQFQTAIYRCRFAHEWFRFRDAHLIRLAKAWLDARAVPYVDDITL